MARIVVEEDVVLRLVGIVLDPAADPGRVTAYADYLSPDLADFSGWRAALRADCPRLYPAEVRSVRDRAELRAQLGWADVAIVESLEIGAVELALAPRLRVVQRFGAGLESIDQAACAARGIAVRTLRRRTNLAVAEHTMALLLNLAKRLRDLDGRVSAARLAAAGRPYRPFGRAHTPNANYGRFPGVTSLRGATLGLVGLGEIGSEVARLAQAFGMRVLYHKRTRLDPEAERLRGVSYRDLPGLCATADFISLHVPANAATAGLIDAALLQCMQPHACLINTSRASLIARPALLAALAAGRPAAIALDVHYEEPVRDDDPLLDFPQLLMIPHTGGGSRQNGLADLREMLTGIDALLTSGLPGAGLPATP